MTRTRTRTKTKEEIKDEDKDKERGHGRKNNECYAFSNVDEDEKSNKKWCHFQLVENASGYGQMVEKIG